MRYVSEDYYLQALLRMGELTAYQTRDSFVRLRRLDPAAVGKAIQKVAYKRMTFGKGLGFVEELRDWKYIVEAIGAVGPRELERNSAHIHITSDGSAVSFGVYGPELSSDHRNWVEVIPVLSARTTTSWDIAKEGEIHGMAVETLDVSTPTWKFAIFAKSKVSHPRPFSLPFASPPPLMSATDSM